MTEIEIVIPAMGEGITEATVTKFIKNQGDTVEPDEVIAEIATDKVDSEIVAPENGIIKKLLVEEGSVAKVGQAIILIETQDSVNQSDNQKVSVTTGIDLKIIEPFENSIKIQTPKEKPNDILHLSHTTSGKFISPLVRSMAKNEGISLSELDGISGSGFGNRLTKEDIIAYLFARSNKATEEKPSLKNEKQIEISQSGKEKSFEYIEMDRMRKLIAEHMIESKKISAHVTSFIEVDVTNLVNWREKIKDEFQKKYAEKITYTPVIIELIVQAIKEFPLINVSVENTRIIIKKDINIGMATALPNGNLIVPVIKGASDLSLSGLTKKVNDLANRARNNKLKPDEIQGGTFTITNLGSFGSLTGTPIINQPEVAILAVGAIKKRPVVIETPSGDTIGIRQMMIISMSYDHRVVDGALGGNFLKRVADLLEGFDPERII